MEKRRILGITARINFKDEIVIVTIGNRENYIVPKKAVTENLVSLGNLVYFELDNGIPCRFHKILPSYFFGEGVSLVPNDRYTVIDNIRGTLRQAGTSGMYCFEVDKLGICAYLGDEKPLLNPEGIPRIGSTVKLMLRLLLDDEKTGEFSFNYTWKAELRRVEDIGVEEAIKFERMEEENSDKELVGIVVSERDDLRSVWTKNTFPGHLGTIPNVEKGNLKVGEWIKMKFSPQDYKLYFPVKKAITTPHFFATNYEVINPTYLTAVRMENGKNVVKITIPNVKTKSDHKTGDDLENSVFGVIGDYQKLVNEGPGKYNITITKSVVKTTNQGNLSVWKVIWAEKDTTQPSRGRSDVRTTHMKERTRSKSVLKKSGQSAERAKKGILWGDEAGKPLEHQKIIAARRSEQEQEGEQEQEPEREEEKESVIYSTVPNQSVVDMLGDMEIQEPRPIISNNLPDGVSIGQDNTTLKRAIIHSLRTNRLHPDGLTFFLWLIDDHIPSIYHTKSRTKHLQLGYAFEGRFKKGNKPNTFECVSDLAEVKLNDIGVSTCGSDIEVSLLAAVHYQYPNCLCHPYFGIIQNSKQLELGYYFNIDNTICVAIIRNKNSPNREWMVNRILPPVYRM